MGRHVNGDNFTRALRFQSSSIKSRSHANQGEEGIKYGAIERSIVGEKKTPGVRPTPTHLAKTGDSHRIVNMYIDEYSHVSGVPRPSGMGHG